LSGPDPAAEPGPFDWRGVVEGYYGRVYDHDERRWLIDRMAGWGMNVYLHAPKDDPLHRERWRDPYDAATMREFEQLIAHGAERDVQVGFSISPGLSIEYGSEADLATLAGKLGEFAERGARFFGLLLDDVSFAFQHDADRERFGTLADAQVHLARSLRSALPGDATIWLVPTDYVGTEPSDYLRRLGEGLPEDVEVGWTGRSVVSPQITHAEAARRSACLGRRLLVWDNVPVNDGPMRTSLHLGPYAGRDPQLGEVVSGWLLNPMEHSHASAITLATAADYMRAPQRYDAEESWQRAVRALGAGAPEAFETFASAHRFGPMTPDERDPRLESAFERVRAGFTAVDEADEATGPLAAVEALKALIEVRLEVAERLAEGLQDRTLAAEIAPWIASHGAETRTLEAAADLLLCLAREEEGLESALAFFRMEGRQTRIEPARPCSYGPRRALYPQLASHDDAGAHFGDDPVLYLDHCLAEEIFRFAESLALGRLGGRIADGPAAH
jgi:hyaluronoglucosaminidase